MIYKIIKGTWRVYDESLVLLYSARGDNGKKYILSVNPEFHPYFYTRKEVKSSHIKNCVKVDNGFYRVICYTPSDVKLVRDSIGIDNCYEADIPFQRRYLIDKRIKLYVDDNFKPCEGKIEYKKLYIDIETDNRYGLSRSERDAILMISAIDSLGNKIVLSQKDLGSERVVLQKFIDYATEYDILIAWNGNNFDFPYIEQRCYVNGIYFRKHIFKFNLFDLMYFYKKWSWKVLPPQQSYSLEAISLFELDEKKEDLGARFWEIYEKQYDKAVKYNLRDCELMKLIDEKRGISDLFEEVAEFAGISVDDTFYSSRVVDALILREYYAKHILPTKNYLRYREQSMESRYTGGEVFDPIPGLHKNCIVFDFASLYPNIIRTFNIGYETLNKIGIKVPNSNITFSSEAGIMSRFITDLLDRRDFYKKEMDKYDRKSKEYRKLFGKQYSIKVIANTIYGYHAFASSRLFDIRIAESITRIGRYLLNFVKSFLEKRNYKVIYGDTDGVAFISKNKSIEMILIEAKTLLISLNNVIENDLKRYGIKENFVKMKFEKIIERALFIKSEKKLIKKRYALKICYEDGKKCDYILIRGLEFIRSEWSKLAKEVQKQIIYYILNGRDLNYILKYIKRVKMDLFSGKYDKDLILNKTIRDITQYILVPAHLKLAKELERKNIKKYFIGEKVPYLVTGYDRRGKIMVIWAEHFNKLNDFQKNRMYWYYYIGQVKSPILNILFTAFNIEDIDKFDKKYLKKLGKIDLSNQKGLDEYGRIE